MLEDGSGESLNPQREDRRDTVSGSSGAHRASPGPANRGSLCGNAKSRIMIRSSWESGLGGCAIASSGIVVAARDESPAAVPFLAESSSCGKNDEAPRAERGRGFDDVFEGWEELLTRLPPLEDEVEDARSRDCEEGDGSPAPRSCGEYT